MKTLSKTLPLALLAFLLFIASCRGREDSASLPTEEAAPVGPGPEEIVARMAAGEFLYPDYKDSDTIVFRDRFVPDRLFPEALRLEPGERPRLVYRDGSSEDLPFDLAAPLRVEIPLERSGQKGFEHYQQWRILPSHISGPGYWYFMMPAYYVPLKDNSGEEDSLSRDTTNQWEDREEGTLDGLRRWRILCGMAGSGTLAYGAPSVLPLEGIIAASSDGTGFIALAADHSILYYRIATGLERSTSLDTPLPPARTALVPPAEGRDRWALSPDAEALARIEATTAELLRKEEGFSFADASFATPFTRVPREGAILVRLRFDRVMNARISLDATEDYLMALYDSTGERLADNLGYGAAKTLSRSFQAGAVAWLALSFLQPSAASAPLVILDADEHRATGAKEPL